MSIFEMSDDRILTIADPIIDNMNEGSNRNDYPVFTRDFSKKMMTDLPKSIIEKQWQTSSVLSNFCKDRVFLGILRRQSMVTILWKQKTTLDEDEYLLTLVLGEEDGGKIKVFGSMVY
jgi:hypothetical protein